MNKLTADDKSDANNPNVTDEKIAYSATKVADKVVDNFNNVQTGEEVDRNDNNSVSGDTSLDSNINYSKGNDSNSNSPPALDYISELRKSSMKKLVKSKMKVSNYFVRKNTEFKQKTESDTKDLRSDREKQALEFMCGIMDECTHLTNFSVPVSFSKNWTTIKYNINFTRKKIHKTF